MNQYDFKFYARFAFFFLLVLIPSLAYLITMGIMMGNVFSSAIFAGLIAALVVGTKNIWGVYQNTITSKTREINDISFSHNSPPSTIQEPIQILENLGFERLGEIDVKMPSEPDRSCVWIFVNDDGSIVSDVIALNTEQLPYFVGFSTAYHGRKLVETSYPYGENIRDDDYHFVGIGDSLEAAYHYHIRQVGRFSEQYGKPIAMNSMERYMKWDKIWRKNFAIRQMMPLTIRTFIQHSFWKLAVAAIATGIFAYSGFPFFNSNLDAMPDISVPILNLIGLFGGLLLALFFTPRRRSIKAMKKKD